MRNIQKRNEAVRSGELGYVFTREEDINHFFETPGDDEIDVRVSYADNRSNDRY